MVDSEESVTDVPETPVSRGTYDWEAVQPSTVVVEAVADVAGCDPISLPPLTDRIDPDALDSFVQTADGGASICFRYASHRLTVWVDGELTVQRADSATDV